MTTGKHLVLVAFAANLGACTLPEGAEQKMEGVFQIVGAHASKADGASVSVTLRIDTTNGITWLLAPDEEPKWILVKEDSNNIDALADLTNEQLLELIRALKQDLATSEDAPRQAK
jgi:hypothetical protein